MWIGNGRGFGDERQARDMLTTKTCVPAMVYGRRLGQLEAVLPGGSSAGGCPHLDTGVVARCWVHCPVLTGPLVLKVTACADGPADGSSDIVGEYGGLEWGGVEDAGLIEALGDARNIRHGFVAGAGALTFALSAVEDGFNGIQAEALPAVLHLDVGQGEAVLQRSGHL